jgi:DNA helicase IV
MTTTIKVSHRVKAMLKERKEKLGLKSADEVLEQLLKEPRDAEDADDVVVARRKRARMAEEEEENERVPQLFSYETLAQEEKAIKYFTGLKQSCMDWVMKVMVDAVR